MEIRTLEQLRSNTFSQVSRISISAGLDHFPEELFRYSDSLEILDLSNNLLDQVPEAISRFRKLRILFLSQNRFTTFPSTLKSCPALSMIGFKSNRISFIPDDAFPETLRWLILTDNRIASIPPSIGNCKPLEKVALAGNQLKSLPPEMASCKNLALLRISANRFHALPEWLLDMPKLAWLAYSGNPCSIFKEDPHLPLISWSELRILETLGQGASGIISKASFHQAGADPQTVAVKVFKGEVTSDGYPADEMRLSSLLPPHDNLVKVLGKLSDHPEGRDGLVFELIPAGYKNLGLPPDFDSCSRDTFPEGTAFHLRNLLAVLKSIASVALELHQNSILHGDLYAHNTLSDAGGHTIFGDFGAATAYNRNDENAVRLERIEVLAFGHLMEDLLRHVHPEEKNTVLIQQLHELRKICQLPEVLLRPDFSHIVQYLNTHLSELAV